MDTSKSLWTPITEDEVKEWRRDLPKGHMREFNTAHTTLPQDDVDVDGDEVTVSTPKVQQIAQAAPPREVAEEIFGQVWKWATKNPDAFKLMAQIVRNSYPAEYSHMSQDELEAKIKEHAEAAARKATEQVYEKYDRGNNLDMWQGKAAMP